MLEVASKTAWPMLNALRTSCIPRKKGALRKTDDTFANITGALYTAPLKARPAHVADKVPAVGTRLISNSRIKSNPIFFFFFFFL